MVSEAPEFVFLIVLIFNCKCLLVVIALMIVDRQEIPVQSLYISIIYEFWFCTLTTVFGYLKGVGSHKNTRYEKVCV